MQFKKRSWKYKSKRLAILFLELIIAIVLIVPIIIVSSISEMIDIFKKRERKGK